MSKINRPLEIQFKEMLNLMNQCDIVEKQNMKRNQRRNVRPSSSTDDNTSKAFQFKNNPFSVFSGIIPGTKWCGTGDIATTYSDLGKLISSFMRHTEFFDSSVFFPSLCDCERECVTTANKKESLTLIGRRRGEKRTQWKKERRMYGEHKEEKRFVWQK